MKQLKSKIFLIGVILLVNIFVIYSNNDISALPAQSICMVYGGDVTNPSYPPGRFYHCSPCISSGCDTGSSWFIN